LIRRNTDMATGTTTATLCEEDTVIDVDCFPPK
jgi:hypothetical protein